MNLKQTIRDELTLARGILSKGESSEASQLVHRKVFRLQWGIAGQVVVEQGTVVSSQTELERYVKDLEHQLASVEDDSRLANRDLQKMRQNQQQVLNLWVRMSLSARKVFQPIGRP